MLHPSTASIRRCYLLRVSRRHRLSSLLSRLLPTPFASVAILILLAASAFAETTPTRIIEAELTIARQEVSIADRTTEAMTVNGGIPGPVLRWRVGDLARIRVTNEMDVPTSIHWHGLLLPNRQDGVPGLTTPGIAPGGSHTFEIPIRHAGTYWYHSHTALQEQRGVYGAIVIEPAEEHESHSHDAAIDYDREVVLVLSDWTNKDPNAILRLLKRGSEYFSVEKGTAQSLLGALRAGELGSVFRRSLGRMPPMDISDIAYDAFLINGRSELTIPASPGERLRLRFVNASASTYFYVGSGVGPLRLIAADGIDVLPAAVDPLLMAIAETYDAILEVPASGRVELRATAQDGSGRVSAWIGEGEALPARDVPRPNLYAMRHAGHGASHAGASAHGTEQNEGTPHEGIESEPHDLHPHMAMPDSAPTPARELPGGMEGMPAGDPHEGHARHEAMAMPHSAPLQDGRGARPPAPYAGLRTRHVQEVPVESEVRTIRLTLTGNMDRYVWSFDGKTLSEADMISVRRGETLRVELENTTMMHHPLHLHGHFFRVLGPDGKRRGDPRAPMKHTVDVPPMQRTTIEFLADADKDWFFHCHVLYHMKAGMSRIFHYEGSTPDADLALERQQLFRDPWYAWADAAVMSHFTEGQITTSNARHELRASWEIGWQDVEDAVDHEVLVGYRYHVSRLYRVFAQASLEEERDAGVFGIEALLPLNFESRAWVDTRGHGRFSLEKELALTARLGLKGEVEYDTEQEWEGSAGLRFRLNRYVGLAFEWHSEFGIGGGLELIY